MERSELLGTERIRKLIFHLGWPGALNFLVITVYNMTDVIFVGHWLGPLQIAAVVVVGTISYLFSSFGLAIGVGGASVIARALGEKNKEKAACVFGNQILLVVTVSLLIVVAGQVFQDSILALFGAYGNILAPSKAYYSVLLWGTPFLSLSMMGNSVIQAEGKARKAMFNSLLPAIVNIMLNPVFIKGFHMGVEGAAWATLVSMILGFFLALQFFYRRKSEIDLGRRSVRLDLKLMFEILAIGGSVLVNIFASNLFIVLLNKVLFRYQQESGVVIYGIISRINMLFLVPILGIDAGIRPVIGYNFGSGKPDRVRDTVDAAMKYGMIICYALLGAVLFAADPLIHLFTNDQHVISVTPSSLRIVLSCFPLFVVEIITVAYFQSIGKPRTALFLTLLRNIILLIPLLYILPNFFGYYGILFTFPVVDTLTSVSAFWLLRNELINKQRNLKFS